ncbi:hypothetical protein BB559_001370 [Furculomyces boomerangus]|uniref:Uncharacterized protein n=2 Tax=Harpellales TaxID=61421 RepID=A0A2T9Z269_9FUNG|nr:hypothetical protein BB559_001370 [Furculomyces boomerangus]PVZ98561.1 hypothetical protein BB558_005434 [Smittium angustum]PWA02143.1 hypothetical protein BB558_001730 [Smittium angustum]
MTSPIIQSEPISLEPDSLMSIVEESDQNQNPNDEGIRIKNSSAENTETGWDSAKPPQATGWNDLAESNAQQNDAWDSNSFARSRDDSPSRAHGINSEETRPPVQHSDSWGNNNRSPSPGRRSFHRRRSISPGGRGRFEK